MPQAAPCPDDARLRELLLGRLDDPQMEQLGEHLLSCEPCAVRAGTLQVADELTVSLRAGDTLLPDEHDPLVQRLASRLHHLRVVPESPRLGDRTLSISSPTEASVSGQASASAAPDGKRKFAFLDAPQCGDEIGRLGAYRVLKVLGQGGMGVVFQAEDTRLGRLCALKAMLPEVAAKPGMKERFLREARAAAQIEHDHIIPIYQVDEDRGVPFIAMPFLKGMSLEDWIRKQANSKPGGASIPAPVMVRLGRQIAKGLAAAHQRGLVHRDIKPANIWLDSSAGGRVKILDFGLARLGEAVDQQNLTQTGLILGTPSYMAPEQARGEKLDGRADLFSLGVILYRLATNVLPFTGKDTMATLMALATHTPSAPHTINPVIPQRLSELIMQLLAKEPAQRVRSAQDVIAALQTVEKDLSGKTSEVNAPTAESNITGEMAASGTAANEPQKQASIAPARTKSARRPPSGGPLIACGMGAAALLLAGIIFFWQSPYGTVRIEINDPSIIAQIDANGVDITKARQRVVRLQPGPHGLRIKQGKLEFETDKFILTKEEIIDLKIERLAGEIRVTADEKLIGLKQLPVPEAVASRDQRTIPATANAQEKMTPEAPQFAIRLDEKRQISNRSFKVDLTRPFTLEAWITPVRNDTEWAGLIRISPVVGVSIMQGADGIFWHFAMGKAAARARLDPANRQHLHVACVRTEEELILYLNGRVEARADVPPDSLTDDRSLAIGDVTGRPYEIWMDEIRISKVARYKKEFAPDKRFEPDDDALALYHCDEGSGEVLNDSSGNGYHCNVDGAKWVKADATSETQRRAAQPIVTTHPKPRTTSTPAPSRLEPSDAKQSSALQKAWAQHLGVPLEFENSVGMKFRLVPPGQLTLGTSAADIEQYIAQAEAAGRQSFTIQFLKAEGPQREVSFDEPFYLGIHEVTQEVWQRVMGDNPSANKSEADLPVENVTWLDALRFCSRLSEHERLPPNYKVEGDRAEHVGTHGYRLPSRDEWEYACRAGSLTRYSFGDDARLLGDYAWFKDNSSGRTHPVGLKLPNPFGLFDMHGNVNELVQPNEKAAMNYKFQQQRGGTYESEADFNRSSIIGSCLRDKGGAWAGFRVVLPLDTTAVRIAGLRDQPPAAADASQNRSPMGERIATMNPPSPPIPKVWTLRSIAQWSIELGGKVLLGDGRVISKVEDLPDTVDRIDLVDFAGLESSFGDAEAKVAGSWPTIKGISVAGTSITDEGLRHLAALPLGNSISASYTSITGKGFDGFREKSLGTILLATCQLSPEGWRHVAAVGMTRAWHLQFSNLNDAALAAIISVHPEMEILNASCRDVTDASAAAIAALSEIRTLVLNTSSISDEGLKKLTGLKLLETLQLKETKVTAAGVEELRQHLPHCTIEWK